MPRLFFATDIHGSETCWKKFLGSASYYGADILVLGGDLTGKALVPLIVSSGKARASLLGSVWDLDSEQAMLDFERQVGSRGYYPIRLSPEEFEALSKDEAARDTRFKSELKRTLERWLGLAEERLPKDLPCFVCPGNDDPFEVDALFASSSRVRDGEGRAIELPGGFWLASTGWSNPSPWKTYREESEEALARRIAALLPELKDHSKAIFNIHAPPHSSGLDEAPELGDDLSVKHAGQVTVPVGSRSVREAIAREKPLLSLHGHIHEGKGVARIGKTLAVNPGSLYEQGVLQGALFELDPRKGIKSYVLTTG